MENKIWSVSSGATTLTVENSIPINSSVLGRTGSLSMAYFNKQGKSEPIFYHKAVRRNQSLCTQTKQKRKTS